MGRSAPHPARPEVPARPRPASRCRTPRDSGALTSGLGDRRDHRGSTGCGGVPGSGDDARRRDGPTSRSPPSASVRATKNCHPAPFSSESGVQAPGVRFGSTQGLRPGWPSSTPNGMGVSAGPISTSPSCWEPGGQRLKASASIYTQDTVHDDSNQERERHGPWSTGAATGRWTLSDIWGRSQAAFTLGCSNTGSIT